MKQLEEDNGGFNILISFYFNMKERSGGPTASGILQPGAVFPQASSVTSGKFLYERTVSVQYKLKCLPKCKICNTAVGPNLTFEMPCVQNISV